MSNAMTLIKSVPETLLNGEKRYEMTMNGKYEHCRVMDDVGAKTYPGGTMPDASLEAANFSLPGTGKKLPWRANSKSP